MKVLGRPPLRQRRRRALRRVFSIILVLLVAGFAALVIYGRQIATRVITAALEEAGVPPDRIEIRRLGFTEIELGPVQLGGPSGPAVSGLAAGWSIPSLIGGRLAYIRVEGLRARARMDEGGLAIEGVPRGQGGSGGAVALPVDRLELVGAQLEFTAGEIKAVAAADATLSGDAHELLGNASIDAKINFAGPDPLHLVAKLPQMQILPRSDGMIVAITQANVDLPDFNAQLAEINADTNIGAAATLKFTAELRDRAAISRVAPLRIALDGAREKDAVSATGDVTSRDKSLDVKFKAAHALEAKRGTLDFELMPLKFEADGRQPFDLFPIVGKQLQKVAGAVSAKGQLGWGNAMTSKADIVIDKLGFSSAVTRIADLDGKLALASLMPARTDGSQHLTAKLQVAGLPDGDIDLNFTLPGDNRLRLDKAAFTLAGGSLEVSGLTLGQNQPVAGELGIRGLDLATLLGLIDVDGLSGTGTIEGRVPVRVDESGVAIMAGRLGAKGPGVVRYSGKALPETGGGPNDSVRLARQALQDFHYTEMTLTLDRGTGGDGSLLVNLKGANPAVLDNHPFVFNVKLETNFDKLAMILLSGYAAAEGLMRNAIQP